MSASGSQMSAVPENQTNLDTNLLLDLVRQPQHLGQYDRSR